MCWYMLQHVNRRGGPGRLQHIIRCSEESGGVKQRGESSGLENRQLGGCSFLIEGDDGECLLAAELPS